MRERIIYYSFRALLSTIRWTPFYIIYLYSSILYFLLFYCIRYRRKLVDQHLKQTFPQQTPQERIQLSKKIYRNLTDVSIESLKGYSMSAKELQKRWTVTNPELLKPFYDQGTSVIILCGHFLNWEWGISLGQQIDHHCISAYKPLHNRYINDYLIHCRSITHCELTPARQMSRCFIKNRRKTRAYALIADQHPAGTNDIHWVKFLNQDTATLSGPEKLAQTFNYPVFYITGRRKKRGYYDIHLTLLSDDPKNTPPGKITEQFMQHLEADIQQSPESWLWTHKRWKLKHPKH